MQVNIEHNTFLKKKLIGRNQEFPQVVLTIRFSEEERQIIKDADIDDVIIMQRPIPAHKAGENFDGIEDVFYLTFGRLIRLQDKNESDAFTFVSPVEARTYDADLKEALKEAKDYLTANETIEEQSSSFEL